jgi:hypothetical protein
VSRNARGVQMEKDIIQDLKETVPLCVLVVVAENRFPDLRTQNLFLNVVEKAHE